MVWTFPLPNCKAGTQDRLLFQGRVAVKLVRFGYNHQQQVSSPALPCPALPVLGWRGVDAAWLGNMPPYSLKTDRIIQAVMWYFGVSETQSSILMPHCCVERGFWGAGGEGTPSSSGRHHSRHKPGPCQAQSSSGSRGRVNPDHSTHFPFPLPGKKITYFLQGDDDFAVLIAALPVARGFSRLGGFKSQCFSTERHFQYPLGSISNCFSGEHRFIWFLY